MNRIALAALLLAFSLTACLAPKTISSPPSSPPSSSPTPPSPTPPSPSRPPIINGLSAEYVEYYTGASKRQIDPKVDFDWGEKAPVTSLRDRDPIFDKDYFLVRWTGQISPRFSQSYTFITTADDGIKLWVNGQALVDNRDGNSGPKERSGTITLEAGKRYDIKLEYDDNTGPASVRLEWQSASQSREVIPQSQLFPVPAPTSPRTFYIAQSGDDANPGTEAQPWKSLQKSANEMYPGDTALVKNGTYALESPIKLLNSGVEGSPVTYKAYPGHKPKIVSNQWVALRAYDSAYIHLEGFEWEGQKIKDQNFSGTAIYITERSHHIQVVGNTVHNFDCAGIGSFWADYVTIERNLLYDNAWNTPYACSAISIYGSVNHDDAPGFHTIVRGNIAYRNENKVPWEAVGKITDGNCIILDNNRHHQDSVQVPSPYPSYKGSFLIENNLCFDNGGRGINAYLSDNATVRNNTIYQNVRTPSLCCDFSAVEASNISFYNNLVYSRADRPATETYNTTNVIFSHNMYFAAQSFPNKSTTDVIADPQFLNPGIDPNAADFHLKSSSPALGQGFPAQCPKVDLEGKARAVACTLGAYE